MPGWLKVLIIIAIVIVVLVLGVIGAGVFWWMKNKDALMSRAKEATTEGRNFGSNTDNQGCVDEGIARYKREPGFTAAISANLFLNSCLPASAPTAGFCDNVPGATEFRKSGEWRAEQCSKVSLGSDHYCQQLFQPVQNYCETKSR